MRSMALIISTLFLYQIYSWADIPAIIKTEAKNYVEVLCKKTMLTLDLKQRYLLKSSVVDNLMHKFQEDVPNTTPKEEFRKELIDFIDQSTNALAELAPIKELIKTFNGSLYCDLLRINYEKNDILLDVDFDKKGNRLEIKLKGALGSGVGNSIFLNINLETKEADLLYFSTQVALPIPAEDRNSKFLMGFVTNMATTMGVPKIELEDGSKMFCPKNRKNANFRVLRIFEQKNSFYEKFGFSPLESELPKIKKELDFASSLKISSIVNRMSEPAYLQRITTDQQKISDVFKNTFPSFHKEKGNSDSLAEYFAWLWYDNCADYINVFKLIFNTKLFFENNPFEDVYMPKYYKILSSK